MGFGLRPWSYKNITTWCGSMLGLGMNLPRKSQDKTRKLHACVWCVLCDLMKCCVNGVHNMICYVCLVIST